MDEAESARRSWKLTRQYLLAGLALLAIGAMAYAVWKAVETPRGVAFLSMLREFLKGLPPTEARIGNAILQNYVEYRDNALRWSGVYHSCLFFSAALGAFAGVVLKLEFFLKNAELKKDIAAFSAMCSALLITFSTVGDFQSHWEVNRLAAARMESLGYEFVAADGRDLAYFSSRMREISMIRNQGIVGSDNSGQKQAPER